MKITLIGDSIRMQYEPLVRAALEDKFEIFAPVENCRYAKFNLRGMWDWKENMQGTRIVHWNCGLWDCCDIFGDGLFTSLEEYCATVLRIADILLSRFDKVIFATTTPVREENVWNDNGEIARFNEAIVPALREKGVIINDLHSIIVKDIPNLVSTDLIHLSNEGIKLAADAVISKILEAAKDISDEQSVSADSAEDASGVPVEFR